MGKSEIRRFKLHPRCISVGVGQRVVEDHDEVLPENAWPNGHADHLVRGGYLVEVNGDATKTNSIEDRINSVKAADSVEAIEALLKGEKSAKVKKAAEERVQELSVILDNKKIGEIALCKSVEAVNDLIDRENDSEVVVQAADQKIEKLNSSAEDEPTS